MKKITGLLILVIAAASFVSSCKKDDKPNTCALTEANLAGSYKVESIKYKLTPTSSEVDGSFAFEPCELDDVTTFNTNHTYTYTDAGTACDPKGDDTGTWSLVGDSLIVDGA
ncbi:MAG: lipocalin family protein, partial [Ginsengibacter sp.]